MEALAVALGAAIGAPARYLLDRFVQDRLTGVFPWGTFAVNLLGSFVLGVVVASTSGFRVLLFGTGFCGAFTTFSTFGYETNWLLSEGSRALAAINVVASTVACVAAALAGWWLGGRNW